MTKPVHMEQQRGGLAVCGDYRSRSLTLDAQQVTCQRCRDRADIAPYPVHLARAAGARVPGPVCGWFPAHELTHIPRAVTCTACRGIVLRHGGSLT